MRAKINNVLEKLLLFIITVMLLSVIWQVISRYLLGSPSTLTDEIASYALIWLGLYGAAYASGKELHLAIDLIPSKVVSRNPLIYSGIVSFAIVVFALLVMVIGGMRLCYLTYLLEQRSAALEIPLAFVYSALPVSGLLITYYSLDSFFMTRRKTLKN
ncbi:TRAP transporter small permease subunit [Flavobacteriaceae bacterium R33]|uniref:TRAP transporter small permease subunit n=2 Tax=Poritiphilus flavus TaxID=2697053 RepID=A0A6L9EHZ5_9FLAO|nr:TRAP transporter small permease subunit [Poritiphilus flavus]